MVRLVASDMDGTLLDPQVSVPPQTYDLVRALARRGVRFVASSGRRLDTLREFFAPVVDEMDFVASNGAQVMVAGAMVDREVFSHMTLRRLKRVVDIFDCLHLALFDSTNSYLLDNPGHFELEVDKDLRQAIRVHDVPDPEVSVIKASIFCDRVDYVMDMAFVLERELGDRLVFAPSGRRWIDVMQAGVSKASGLEQVLEHYGIDARDAMAFGDSMNDYEILRMVGHPRAMGNGRYAVKQVAGKVIGTNAENAVQAALASLLEALGPEGPAGEETQGDAAGEKTE